MTIRYVLVAMALFASSLGFAGLHCPSISQIKQAQMSEVRPTCDALTTGCKTYASYGFINHNGETWAVGTGEFSASQALSSGQSLLSKAEKPYTTTRRGIEFCVYYASFWTNKYIGAVPASKMPQRFSIIQLLK